jgi:hypothetical protein
VDQPTPGPSGPERLRSIVPEDAAASLAEALSVFHDDEERATRINYLVDEAFPSEPFGRRLQEPDEAKRAVRAFVANLDDAEFERRWEGIEHAAQWQVSPDFSDALREVWRDRRYEEVRALAAADRAATDPVRRASATA